MFLIGDDSEIWNESRLEDLVSLEATTPDGTGSSPLIEQLARCYHKVLGRYIHVSMEISL
jgi:hypothetical protein